jgi:hypothetical protein
MMVESISDDRLEDNLSPVGRLLKPEYECYRSLCRLGPFAAARISVVRRL